MHALLASVRAGAPQYSSVSFVASETHPNQRMERISTSCVTNTSLGDTARRCGRRCQADERALALMRAPRLVEATLLRATANVARDARLLGSQRGVYARCCRGRERRSSRRRCGARD